LKQLKFLNMLAAAALLFLFFLIPNVKALLQLSILFN